MNTKLITEFDTNATTKTSHFRKRIHKRPNGDVGISVWTYETQRMNKQKDHPIVADILRNIVPHEVGTNPYEDGTEYHDNWEEMQRQFDSFDLYGDPFAHRRYADCELGWD